MVGLVVMQAGSSGAALPVTHRAGGITPMPDAPFFTVTSQAVGLTYT